MYKHRFGKIKKCIQTPNLTKTSIITPSKKFNQTPNCKNLDSFHNYSLSEIYLYSYKHLILPSSTRPTTLSMEAVLIGLHVFAKLRLFNSKSPIGEENAFRP